MAVGDYQRPYVALWVEQGDQSFVGNLAVWYDLRKRNNKGARWLQDLRSWWRVSGSSASLPIDGVTGATRAAGSHALSFPGQGPVLASCRRSASPR